MIDDDWTLDEGDRMPAAYWPVSDFVTVVIRIRTSRIPTAPLLALANEFQRASNIYGPLYLSLHRYTCFDAYDPHRSPARDAYDTVVAAHPDTFTTVIGANGPCDVWLTLRLTRLTDAVADTILTLRRPTATPARP
jgi:hypothetical protein